MSLEFYIMQNHTLVFYISFLFMQFFIFMLFANNINTILYVIYCACLLLYKNRIFEYFDDFTDIVLLFFYINTSIAIFLMFFYTLHTSEIYVYATNSRITENACSVFKIQTTEDLFVTNNTICNINKMDKLSIPLQHHLHPDPTIRMFLGNKNNSNLRLVTCQDVGIHCYNMSFLYKQQSYSIPWSMIQEIHSNNAGRVYAAFKHQQPQRAPHYDVSHAIDEYRFIRFQSVFQDIIPLDTSDFIKHNEIKPAFFIAVPDSGHTNVELSVNIRRYSAETPHVCVVKPSPNPFHIMRELTTNWNFILFLDTVESRYKPYMHYIFYTINILLALSCEFFLDFLINTRKKRNLYQIFINTIAIFTLNPVLLIRVNVKKFKRFWNIALTLCEIMYCSVIFMIVLSPDFREQKHDHLKTRIPIVPCTYFHGILYYTSVIMNYTVTLYSIIVNILILYGVLS